MRLINIDIFPLLPNKLDGDESEYERGYHDATDNLKALPLVDAVPVVRGEWIAFMEMDFFTILDGLKCSICGSKHNPELATEYRYCPDCGAKMEDV